MIYETLITLMPKLLSLVSSGVTLNSWEMEKVPKCLPTDKRMRKLWYIYVIEYYSAVKKKN